MPEKRQRPLDQVYIDDPGFRIELILILDAMAYTSKMNRVPGSPPDSAARLRMATEMCSQDEAGISSPAHNAPG